MQPIPSRRCIEALAELPCNLPEFTYAPAVVSQGGPAARAATLDAAHVGLALSRLHGNVEAELRERQAW